MRTAAGWVDVTLLNISSRGLLVQTEVPPASGTYVEIRRAHHVVIGRAVWTKGRHFGVRTQDKLDVDGIIRDPKLADAAGRERLERRTDPMRVKPKPDMPARLDRSRNTSSTMQFLMIGAAGIAAAAFIASTVSDILSKPFAVIEAHL